MEVRKHLHLLLSGLWYSLELLYTEVLKYNVPVVLLRLEKPQRLEHSGKAFGCARLVRLKQDGIANAE